MAQLLALLKSLDSVGADDKKYYKEEDGVFVLDTEAYFAGMSSARDKEKQSAKEAREKLEKFQGLDPDAAKLALAKVQELEEKQHIDAGNIEQVVANRTERLRLDLEGRLNGVTAERDNLASQLSSVVVDKSVQAAAAAANVIPSALDDVLERARKIFKAKDGNPVPMKGDEITYGKDGKTPMTIAEWLEELKDKAPHLFKQAEGSNGGRPGGKGAAVGGLEGLSGTEKLKAARRQPTR